MSYDELLLLKARATRQCRSGQEQKALLAIAEFATKELTVEIQKQLIPLLRGINAASEEQLLALKYILQHLDESLRLQACQEMLKASENEYVVSWLCECDAKFQNVHLAPRSPFLVENYLRGCPVQYFCACLARKGLWFCQEILKQHNDEACELLLQAVIRRNFNAFKLIRNRYKAELAGCERFLDEAEGAYFKQQAAAADLD